MKILDKIYGCVIGGAIGDALGAPVECWDFRDIRAKYGKIEQFMPSYIGNTGCEDSDEGKTSGRIIPGLITDDTVLRHYLCLTII